LSEVGVWKLNGWWIEGERWFHNKTKQAQWFPMSDTRPIAHAAKDADGAWRDPHDLADHLAAEQKARKSLPCSDSDFFARWVVFETWHPEQQPRWLDDGRFVLSVPYSNDCERIMDILKYGADVKVIAPDDLREAAKNQLGAAASQYRCGEAPCSGIEPGRG
jgi:predicted DNA-binding transcriptional regulator YafY